MCCKKLQNWFWETGLPYLLKPSHSLKTLRFREKKACLELTCTCINIVCHCSVLQEECWWNCHVNIPRKKNVLPSFNVACFSAFVTYGLYRKQKHSHFLCKLLSIFSHFLNLLQGFVDILIYIFSLSLWTVKKGKKQREYKADLQNFECFMFTCVSFYQN